MEEAVGFEPTERLSTPAGFQDQFHKPLGHASVYSFHVS